MNENKRTVIHIEDLTKSYGKARGVMNVSLDVYEGEVFGFLGPNGAGKSTTIRSMLGLIRYEQGSIRILGQNAAGDAEPKKAAGQATILKDIGYMPSEAWFYRDMTVKDVLRFAESARHLDCREEREMLCDRLQLDPRKRISDLSLGNRKKVSIVAAMQHRPKLFIFDEPTSGLDPLMQSTFFQLIHEYVDQGATCLLSTHVLSEVREHCDRVGIMKEGHLLCVDTVENLVKKNARRVITVEHGVRSERIYEGPSQTLLQELVQKNPDDVLIEELSMEDIFMHYYEKNENGADVNAADAGKEQI